MTTGCLENAVVRLLRERPFYGHFILNVRREERGLDGKPAGVTFRNGMPTMTIDPVSFEPLAPPEQQALLEHLVKHLLHLHMLRGKGRNQHDWNICCDLAINPDISNLPSEYLQPDNFDMIEGLAAEEYYDQLASPFHTGNLDGSGYGDAEKEEQGAAGLDHTLDAYKTIDDHSEWSDADSTPLALGEEMVRAITRESLRGCDGETPTELRSIVDVLLRPSPIPWRQILRQFIATAGRTGRKSTWMREHRRFSHDTPGIVKRRRLNLLVVIDVSDSTNIESLREAFAVELLQITRNCDAKIILVYANCRIKRVEVFKSSAYVAERYDGGGFTDLRPVFEYAKKQHPLPTAVVYLTDGLGPVPEQMEFPTLWVLTGDGEKPAPWGIELRLGA
jgi:predicted metal-dependent peptidase